MIENIETNRLVLSFCTAETLNEIMSGKMFFKLSNNWPESDVLDAIPIFIEMVESGQSSDGFGMWLMKLKSDDLIVGGMGFCGNPDACGMVEIGYSIDIDYRRNGYMYEACNAIINDFAFKNDKVSGIKAECDIDNIASINLLKKLGMKKTGTNQSNKIEWFKLK